MTQFKLTINLAFQPNIHSDIQPVQMGYSNNRSKCLFYYSF